MEKEQYLPHLPVQRSSNGVGEAWPLPSGGHLAMSEDVFGCRSGEVGVLLASSGVVARGAAKQPTVPITATFKKDSAVPRLRNPSLKVKTEGSMCVRRKILAES